MIKIIIKPNNVYNIKIILKQTLLIHYNLNL